MLIGRIAVGNRILKLDKRIRAAAVIGRSGYLGQNGVEVISRYASQSQQGKVSRCQRWRGITTRCSIQDPLRNAGQLSQLGRGIHRTGAEGINRFVEEVGLGRSIDSGHPQRLILGSGECRLAVINSIRAGHQTDEAIDGSLNLRGTVRLRTGQCRHIRVDGSQILTGDAIDARICVRIAIGRGICGLRPVKLANLRYRRCVSAHGGVHHTLQLGERIHRRAVIGCCSDGVDDCL